LVKSLLIIVDILVVSVLNFLWYFNSFYGIPVLGAVYKCKLIDW